MNIDLLNCFDELFYINDANTYDILFVSDSVKKIFGENYGDGKCHEYFHGKTSPCEFCAKKPDKFDDTEGFDEAFGGKCIFKDKLVEFDGKEAHIRIIRPRTNQAKSEFAGGGDFKPVASCKNLLDDNFTLVSADEGYLSVFGYSELKKKFGNCSVEKMFENNNFVKASEIAAMFKNRTSNAYFLRFTDNSGKARNFFVSAVLDDTKKDGVRTVNCSYFDFTGYSNIVSSINRFELLNIIYNDIQYGIVHFYPKTGRVRFANDYTLNMIGYTRSYFKEFYHNNVRRLVYEDDLPEALKAIERVNDGEENAMFDARIKTYRTEPHWFRINISACNFRGMEGLCQAEIFDINNYKNYQIEWESEKERYHLLLESSSDIIFEYSVDLNEFTSYGDIVDNSVPRRNVVVLDNFTGRIRRGEITPERYTDRLLEFFSGENTDSFEVKTYSIDSERDCNWNIIEGMKICGSDGSVKIIGKFKNINKEKESELAAIEMLKTDKITQLYIKDVGEEMI
ncbi:MAG: PAS domain-containing protein, partial [Oscillospiraceae bacterium]|nr:PAS domain-containing protein [Oscillospiraceae bacterium]